MEQELIIRWFYKKSLSNKNSVDKEEALQVIKNKQNKPFTKLKDNFIQAVQMYDIKVTYEECIEIYKKLIAFLYKLLKNNLCLALFLVLMVLVIIF